MFVQICSAWRLEKCYVHFEERTKLHIYVIYIYFIALNTLFTAIEKSWQEWKEYILVDTSVSVHLFERMCFYSNIKEKERTDLVSHYKLVITVKIITQLTCLIYLLYAKCLHEDKNVPLFLMSPQV